MKMLNSLFGNSIEHDDPESLPEFTSDFQIALGKPPPVMAEVRARLQELWDNEAADLQAEKAGLEAKRDAEMALVAEGDASVDELMAAGKSRDEIIAARSASSVALEMAQGYESQIDRIDDQLDVIKKKHINRRDRAIRTLDNTEIATRVWLIDFCQGKTQATRLNPDRALRGYSRLLQAQTTLAELLDSPRLAARALRTATTFVAPTNQYDSLWEALTQRNRDEFKGSEPEVVLKRLDDLINQKEPENE